MITKDKQPTIQHISLLLITLLMMFPQFAETIYSPALTDIAKSFNESAEKTSQTLSLYFFAFALGVVFWGRMCDTLGRRPTTLWGLGLYTIASIGALISSDFSVLLVMRVLSAFGAAVGSISTQTMLRDQYQGHKLIQVYSLMGVVTAISPSVGVFIGAILTHFFGYQGVFTSLAMLGALLLAYSTLKLEETRPQHHRPVSFSNIFFKMVSDIAIWRNAFMVGLFSLSLFSYYQLAPFSFERLGISTEFFGYTGFILTLGVGLGAGLNRALLAKGIKATHLVLIATLLNVIGSILVNATEDSIWFILPMIIVVTAFGIAIPNLLAHAINRYKKHMGTAGAIFGLMYYLILGAGLVLAGVGQSLGLTLMITACILPFLSISLLQQARIEHNRHIKES